ncbi:MAG TPA: hypothetical protein VK207_01945 [Bacteroidales bacterium]|nr:hypothetical protein [Bacteroidales bacterium]
MKKRDPEEKAAGLFKNELTPGEEKEIIRELGEEGITPGEAASMTELSSDLENAFAGETSEKMDDRFYSMLENESMKERKGEKHTSFLGTRHSWMPVAAGIALFILGWFSASVFEPAPLGRDELTGLSREVNDLRETLVLTMLDQNSASERIKAVNMIRELGTPNGTIIENLFKALNTDENDNVRLLALEALVKYADNKEVREGLVASISKQTSPMIQLRMTEIMTALNEKSSVTEFRRLLENPELNYSIRTKIGETVGTLL